MQYSSFTAPSGSLLNISSFSGIPQHWHICCRGAPRSVFIDTSNTSLSSFSVSVFGTVSPFSQRETACRVTISLCASSSCESPLFMRSS